MRIIKFDKYLKIIFSGVAVFSLLNSCSGETFKAAANDYGDASRKPRISSLVASNNVTLSLSFDMNLDENSAQNANYSIVDENGAPLTIASIQTGEKSVTLATASQDSQGYTIEVSGVKSANTVEMEPYSGNFSGDGLPEIVNVTSGSNDGAFYAGEEILILVEFSEPVDVTGLPTLLMNTGIMGSTAIYTSGSGTNILTFSYIIASGDSSSNLDYSDTNSLYLNGGTIIDLQQNDAAFSLPVPGEIGSFSYNKSFSINSTEFSVSDVTVNEEDGSAAVTIAKTGDSPAVASVDYSTSDSSAIAALDYTATSGTLSWISGETGGKTFTIPIIDDFSSESDENFTVTLSNAIGATINNSTATITITDIDSMGPIAPYVLNVVSTNSTKIRITFSEAVDATQATTLASYELHDNGSCTSTTTAPTAVSQISTSVYELDTVAQTPGQTYCLLVARTINDQNEGLPLTDPKFSAFLGNEQLRIVSASCINPTNIKVVFNKDVMTGGLPNGADDTSQYTITGVSNLGGISPPSISNNEVTLTHATAQDGGIYTVIGSNGTDGDGFDDSPDAIRDSADTENLQASPNDRASFTGCGTEVVNFSDGPISSDPFGDGSDFGYVNTYNGKIFVGPNTNGNGVNRFEPAGVNPTGVTFSFSRDTYPTGTTHDNTAALPIVSIGHSACAPNSNDKDLGCGPDNEDGRGLFASGIITGTEYLFLTGAKSDGDNDYLYWTNDTDTTLNFNYIDLSTVFNVNGNKGTESIVIFNDKIYWMAPGNFAWRPYFLKINNTNTDPASGVRIDFRWMAGMGDDSALKPNWADKIGGTLFGFNNRLYVASSGSITDDDVNCTVGDIYSNGSCEQTGGIVRSTNTDPAVCTAADVCPDWVDISPSGLLEFESYFSIVLTQLSDLIPAMRPHPAFASFNGNLFLIRNACTRNMIDRTYDGDANNQDDVTCAASGGTEVPQLWKCDPTNDGADGTNPTTCESGEWALIDGISAATDGLTNFGDADNLSITLLITNGAYLYVGFDNSSATGIEIWRTDVTNPTAEDDFTQIGTDGLGNANNQEIYSATSVQDGVDYYIYVSTGQSGLPVSVYRQKNN